MARNDVGLQPVPRPLRIEMAGGWHHVTARGNEHKRVARQKRLQEIMAKVVKEMSDVET